MIYTFGGMKYSMIKTLAAVRFAEYLAKKQKVLFIDTDPSKRACEFFESNENITIISNYEQIEFEEIEERVKHFDSVVIDSGLGKTLRKATLISDRMIIPFTSKDRGLWTIWTLKSIENLCYNLIDENPKLKCLSFYYEDPQYVNYNTHILSTLKESQYIDFLENDFFQNLVKKDQEEEFPEVLMH